MSVQDLYMRDHLTPREWEVLQLIGECYDNQQIADTLFCSVKTVEMHCHNIGCLFRLEGSPYRTRYQLIRVALLIKWGKMTAPAVRKESGRSTGTRVRHGAG